MTGGPPGHGAGASGAWRGAGRSRSGSTRGRSVGRVAVRAAGPCEAGAAAGLAAELGVVDLEAVDLGVGGQPGGATRGVLHVERDRLRLVWLAGPGGSGRVDWVVDHAGLNVTPGAGASLRQPIARAVGLRRGEPRPRVLDATAGWAGDSLLLAALGCEVLACEREPVVALLAADGLRRAWAIAGLREAVGRVWVGHADGVAVMRAGAWLGAAPEVVYLDPMFPARRKAALPGKGLWVLQRLTEPDADTGGRAGGSSEEADAEACRLLGAALATGARRVVVKRPRHAPAVAAGGAEPVSSHAGRGHRFDVYVP